MKSGYLMATIFGAFITICYTSAVLVLGTNGALLTIATNALLAILMLTVMKGDKQKLKKILGLIIGENDGESGNNKDLEGQSQNGRDAEQEEP